jgi:DNA-binding CsgD family transcriptional regulator
MVDEPHMSERQRQAREAYSRLGSIAAAARELGINESSMSNLLRRSAKKVTVDSRHEKIETVDTNDGLLVNVQTLERIQTAEQALRKAGIDTAIWKPIKVTANSWEVAIKQNDKTAKTVPLWQVKVVCERRVPESIDSSVDVLAQRIMQGQFLWPKVRHRLTADPSTMVIGLVDHHFGKLCWGPETNNVYDLKIASTLYSRAIEASVSKCDGRDVTEIIMPIGNDFGHIDTRAGTTEAGTPQDRDGRYEKIAGILESAVINAVAVAREIAPVRILWVGGNHDPVTSMWLCRCIHWAFEKDKHVTVDTTPCPVKYVHFGKCLLGFAHGDAPREKALKDMMPIERADEWAASKSCREWLTGHLHQQKRTERIGTHEEAGQVFRILPSLCGTDSWHYRNGFSMSRKATESYLYSHRYGFDSCFQESAEKLLDID